MSSPWKINSCCDRNQEEICLPGGGRGAEDSTTKWSVSLTHFLSLFYSGFPDSLKIKIVGHAALQQCLKTIQSAGHHQLTNSRRALATHPTSPWALNNQTKERNTKTKNMIEVQTRLWCCFLQICYGPINFTSTSLCPRIFQWWSTFSLHPCFHFWAFHKLSLQSVFALYPSNASKFISSPLSQLCFCFSPFLFSTFALLLLLSLWVRQSPLLNAFLSLLLKKRLLCAPCRSSLLWPVELWLFDP